MLRKIAPKILRNLSNIPGWRTDQKLVVFESDDWGSVRMPSVNAFNNLTRKGIDIISGDAKRYNLYDTLANPEDLAGLFDVLNSFKDRNNSPAVFTALSIMANPDFKKIKENNFKEYYYEPFTKTLENYYGTDLSFKLWKEGIENKIFAPQFHAREHLNIAEWMRALQAGDSETLEAFEEGVWGFYNKNISGSSIAFQAAFDLYEPEDLGVQAAAIKDGLVLFKKLFGYSASYFVPPNGPINNALEGVAAEGGIKYMYAAKMQIEPQGHGKNKKIFHWLGQQNQHNQRYLTRNCFFEPSQQGKDWISDCLNNIAIAFYWQKPAVISSHRVNYIGALYPENRDRGLNQLKQLLQLILKNWPEVEFCTSDELGDKIVAAKK